ncbi:hypothetical protein G7Y79_00031g066120 [Physcia stellaris]|nr:hypothetical protein G7Y79_00031g066120 [Physcia stellaris]
MRLSNHASIAAKVLLAVVIAWILVIQLKDTSPGLLLKSNHPAKPASHDPIPKKIWQTWQTPAAQLAGEEKARVSSWLDKNPEYQYELLTDRAAETFVRRHFSQEPFLHDTFLTLNDTILRADFLRYLHLNLALPELYTSASAIVGIEADRHPVENDIKLYSDYRPHIWSINNWTFASRPRHPFLRLVVESVARNLRNIATAQNRSLAQIEASYKQVIDSTGPAAFSAAFLEYASQVSGRRITGEDASMLEEPKAFGDVVVLPIRAMSTAEADRADGDGARSRAWPAVLFHWSVGSWKGSHAVQLEPRPTTALDKLT